MGGAASPVFIRFNQDDIYAWHVLYRRLTHREPNFKRKDSLGLKAYLAQLHRVRMSYGDKLYYILKTSVFVV